MRFIMLRDAKNSLLVLLLNASVALGTVFADELDISVKQGDYEVFYSAFNTSFLSPEVASAAGFVRARNRGLVNISIVRYQDGERIPVEASTIAGQSYDLIYRENLDFKPIAEPGAQYYLAPFKIANDNEFIQFEITVVPEGLEKEIAIKFKRQFYLD